MGDIGGAQFVVSEPTYRVKWWVTTGRISGSLQGGCEYFFNRKDALHRYIELYDNSHKSNHSVKRVNPDDEITGVELHQVGEWNRVL